MSDSEFSGADREHASLSSRERQDAGDSDGFFETVANRFEELRHRLDLASKIVRGSPISVRPYQPAVDGHLSTFEVPDGEEEIDRYWVNAPFAYVVITYDDAASERYYHAVEPDLDSFEQHLL